MRPNHARPGSSHRRRRACDPRLAGCGLPDHGRDAPARSRQTQRTESEWRRRGRHLEASATRKNPHDAEAGYPLRRRPCAPPASAPRPSRCWNRPRSIIRRTTPLLGAYGRALADTGDFNQALDVLGRAHTPDQPDWRILSAQGAVLDQMGRHEEARRYYASALKIVPDEPSVLSNLGLSYALSKDLPQGRRRPCASASAQTGARAARAAEPRARGRLAGPLPRSRSDRARRPVARGSVGQCRLPAPDAEQTKTRPQEDRKRTPSDAKAGRCKSVQLRSDVSFAGARTDGVSDADITRIAAGPRITMNSTGRKNRIIGTVSFGGSAGGLLLRFRHAHVAVFLRQHAQGLASGVP